MLNKQLPLTIGLKDSATFASYFPGPNVEALTHLRRLTGKPWEPGVYLWGGSGTGKSHLLQAVCHAAGERNGVSVYLPMRLADQFPREALHGLETVGIVCIDDIQAIAGDYDWELAVIHLFERIRETGGVLVVAGNAMPAEMGLGLSHLISRLAWGLQFQLQPLDEAGKLSALQLRASRRGIELPIESGRYLVRHSGQDMNRLFSALEALDRASLVAKRRLTVPFISEVLKEADLGEVR
jgi:DnaA family protein